MNNKEYILPNGNVAIFEYDVCGIGKISLEAMDMLMGMITATDKVRVVRCKNCIHHMGTYCYRVLDGDEDIYKRAILFPVDENDFCSNGETK